MSSGSRVGAARRSHLDAPPAAFVGRPFIDETLLLLRSVRDHDYDALAEICDDDFGIVDGDPTGRISIVRTRQEWEHWFHTLFATLRRLGARTDSEILAYDAVRHETMGFAALEFRQVLEVGAVTSHFDCVATIVWKRTPAGWREARWHVSVLSMGAQEP